MFRVTVRVRPGSARTHVGGRHPVGERDALVVKVRERAVDGRATAAVVRAVAVAFGVRASTVSVATGASSRTKVLRIEGDQQQLRRRLEGLLDG